MTDDDEREIPWGERTFNLTFYEAVAAGISRVDFEPSMVLEAPEAEDEWARCDLMEFADEVDDTDVDLPDMGPDAPVCQRFGDFLTLLLKELFGGFRALDERLDRRRIAPDLTRVLQQNRLEHVGEIPPPFPEE